MSQVSHIVKRSVSEREGGREEGREEEGGREKGKRREGGRKGRGGRVRRKREN